MMSSMEANSGTLHRTHSASSRPDSFREGSTNHGHLNQTNGSGIGENDDFCGVMNTQLNLRGFWLDPTSK